MFDNIQFEEVGVIDQHPVQVVARSKVKLGGTGLS